MSESKKLPQYIYAVIAAGGAFLAGCGIAWTNPSQPRIQDKKELGFDVSNEEYSWVGSVMTLGAMFMCIPAGFLINVLGRKISMIVLMVPILLCWLLTIFAQNAIMLCIGRFVLGMGIGFCCVCVPMYTSEIAQAEIRGACGTFFQFMITGGILFVIAVGAGVSVKINTGACAAVTILFLVLAIFLPESPTYYVIKENFEAATKSLKRLRGAEYNTDSELNELKATEQKLKDTKVNVMQALKRRSSLKALLVGLGLMFFQQLSGINAVMFYSTNIFEAAGSTLNPAVQSSIIAAVQVLFCAVSLVIVDRAGRKILLFISSLCMCISTTLLGVFFFMKSNNEKSVSSIGWLPLVSLCLFIAVFSIGYGPVPWLMMGEIFAMDVKGPAGSLAATFNWFLAFIVSKFYPTLKDALGGGPAFWIFSVFSALGIPFLIFIVPETKGKSLNDIQQGFEKKE